MGDNWTFSFHLTTFIEVCSRGYFNNFGAEGAQDNPITMAGLYTHSGVSRKSTFQFWIWCLCFISMLCISVKCSDKHGRCSMRLRHDSPTNSSVTLRWTTDCSQEDFIITGYNISYCPIDYSRSSCDTSVDLKYLFVTNPKQLHVTIHNLYSFTTYKFTFALSTIDGPKNMENAIIVITTPEGTPTSPRNVYISNVYF
ncbi:jg20485 [Pararge aegeria aegeria]|uniref:Jg20485 protein n=1 Tax=Pararge aegeria aegeria TaxID=348720 RepID=A0A8S4S0A9_9NEOP|nr:jg20485 [Pararge aegeria aegeria]